MIKSKFFFFFLFICLFTFRSSAQHPLFYSISDEQGLPSNEVYSIVQDYKGIIWIGTDAGIFRYNGITFQSFTSNTQKTQAITGLVVSPSNTVYCYNFSGQLFKVHGDSLSEIKGQHLFITSCYADQSNNIWITSNNSVSFFNESSQKWNSKFNLKLKEVPANTCKYIRRDKEGDFWFLGNLHVNKIVKDSIIAFDVEYPLNSNTNLLEHILVITPKEIYLFDVFGGSVLKKTGKVFTPFIYKPLLDVLKGRKINNINYLPDGNIWILTYNGVVLFNPETKIIQEYYTNTAFSDCFIDREKSIWLTSLTDGLFRLPDISNKVWNSTSSKLITNKINGLALDNSSVFFTQFTGIIGKINLKTEKLELFNLSQKSDIRAIKYLTEYNAIFFNSSNYLYQFKNDKIEKIKGDFPPIKHLDFIENKLIVASSRGVFVYSKLEGIKNPDTLINTWSRELSYDKINKKLFVASNDGLHVFSYVKGEFVFAKTLLKGGQVTSICQSNNGEGINYAVTFRGEIFQIKNNTSTKITQLQKGIQIKEIVFNSKKLYCATNLGLWIYDLTTHKWDLLNQTNGLISSDIINVLFHKKFIWIATSNGIQKIPIEKKQEIPKALIHLRSIRINEKIIKDYKDLRFDHNDNLFVELEGSVYSSGRNFVFAYRFNNGDTTWQFITPTSKAIKIPIINNGKFRLEIKIIDFLKRDSQNKILINGYVDPPYFQRWWFYFLVGLFGILISYFVFLNRVNKLKTKQKEKLTKINLENNLKLAQQEALTAQMNPHFIFNVLNSIKGYIYSNDKKNATKYLNSFSDLMRRILILSSNSLVYIEEEIEVLKIYIELEAMLLENDFTYSITTANNIDVSFIKIPPLLIQPFVENAFKHGLRHKKGSKHLSIEFVLDEKTEQLIITIIDNGIGREKANLINVQQINNHASFSTEASKKRIDLLNDNQDQIIGLEIIDNFDSANEACGTSIILQIKIDGINT